MLSYDSGDTTAPLLDETIGAEPGPHRRDIRRP